MASTTDLGKLPAPSERRVAVRVTPDAERQLRGGHPWVYTESIISASHEAAEGDLAVVFDHDRRFLAIGLWDPGSPIRVKVLHRGRPAQIDGAWWQGHLAAALAIREPLATSATTTGYRCVNGENDGFPGLVLDRYAETYVFKLYTAAWLPHLRHVLEAIVDQLHPQRVVLRLARSLGSVELHGLSEGMALIGLPPDGPVLFLEHGLTFAADVVEGQKTGHFLDQRENRALLRTLVEGSRVLDVFSANGGFSVYAAAGGAAHVTSVDISRPALVAAVENMTLNRGDPAVAACTHETVAGDAFEVMDRLHRGGTRYDAVVLDPPSFAQRQASVARALAAYGELTRRAIALLEPGGLLLQASCSSRVTPHDFFSTIKRVAGLEGVELEELRRTGHALDHPVTFAQGGYLKALFARLV
jgi:23S rRNA (cytosine1962-C5)-methyltransferase